MDTPSPFPSWLKKLDRLNGQSSKEIDFQALFGPQRQAVQRIVEAVQRIAVTSFTADQEERGAPPPRCPSHDRKRPGSVLFDRPHNAFLIDGARGSGKTTSLLKIRHLLGALQLSGPIEREEEYRDLSLMRARHARGVWTCYVLPMIMPNDLLDHQSLMEAVLAQIRDDLEADTTREEDKALLEQLENVYLGWAAVRPDGRDALVKDSLDFREFSRQRSRSNAQSYNRVNAWHDFITNFLDAMNSQLLVLVVDDIDIDPADGNKIVEDIKQYMSLPRIVTIVAADLTLMQRELTRRRYGRDQHMAQLLLQLDALQKRIDRSKRYWDDCNFVILAGLEKIFPMSFRCHIGGMTRKDYETILCTSERERSTITLTEIFIQQFLAHNESVKQLSSPQSPLGAEQGGQERPGGKSKREARRRQMEWWLINGAHSALMVDTIRGMIQLLHRIFLANRLPSDAKAFPYLHHEPLPSVFLNYYKASEIADVVTRVGSIADAILGKEIATSWQATQVRRESEEIPEVSYGEHVCDYWLDTELGANHLDPQTVPALREWLPVEIPPHLPFHSHNVLPRGPWGVAASLGTSILPWSCLYVSQLRTLDPLIQEISFSPRYRYTPLLKEGQIVNMMRLQELRLNNFESLEKMIATHPCRAPDSEDEDEDDIRGTVNLVAYWRIFSTRYNTTGPDLFNSIQNIQDRHQDDYSIIYDVGSILSAIQNALGGLTGTENRPGSLSVTDESPKIRASKTNTRESMDPGRFQQFQNFCRDINRRLEEMEAARNFFIVQWVLSSHLAKLGNDFEATRYHGINASTTDHNVHLTSWSAALADDTLFNAPGDYYRLERLAQVALETVRKRSIRTAILHAWSLTPLVRGLFWIDDGVIPSEKASGAWTTIQTALEEAHDIAQKLLNNDDAIDALWKKGCEADAIRPENYLSGKSIRDWTFADINDDQLSRIVNDLDKEKKDLSTRLKEYDRILKIHQNKNNDPENSLRVETAKKISKFFKIGDVPALKIVMDIDGYDTSNHK